MKTTYEIKSEFVTYNTDPCGNGGTGLAIYRPVKQTPRSRVAVLAVHGSGYMGFTPMIEMARHGFTAAGLAPRKKNVDGWLKECDQAITYLRNLPGIEKVVLMGHSQGGCMLSCYQYIAENGTDRFKNTDRLIPFPDVPKLTPGDGLMLIDANYGIMSVLALDPAVRSIDSGYGRIKELDIFEPENGYVPGGSRYSEDFIRKFQREQVKYYKSLLAYACERYELIKNGRGMFCDDEPIVIPGGGGGSNNNKPFCMDTRLLGRTERPRPLLHKDGSITVETVYTVRTPTDSVHSSRFIRGAATTTVLELLRNEVKLDDDFGYDDCHMWGIDGNFNYLSTRENVKGIHVPLLCQGNTASHEFVNTEFNYESAASEDKDIIFSEGARHSFRPVNEAYGDTHKTTCDYFVQWLSKPGRFLAD